MTGKWMNKISIILFAALLTGCSLKTAETEDSERERVELDYKKGIADGVYGWNLSEDGSFYILRIRAGILGYLYPR